MFNISGLDHINIQVKSLASAKDFYQKYFGMKVIQEYSYESSIDKSLIHFLLIGIPQKNNVLFL